MPEGHTIHRLAKDHRAILLGHPVSVSSPQGRFATGAELLTGRVLESIEPYGKHLFYGFEGDTLLHVHLGLYGKWTPGTGPAPEPRGALRVRLQVTHQVCDLRHQDHWLDLRGPTACEIMAPHERDAVLARLGPDPLRTGADPDLAWARLSKSRRTIGELLMDQRVLAGVGNVYRAELLLRAGVSPFRQGTALTRGEWDLMWADLRRLMQAGVRANRIVTTEPADRDRRSGPVRREDAHYVYRRHDLPCRRCGTAVRTQVMAARNLFWCPTCQVA